MSLQNAEVFERVYLSWKIPRLSIINLLLFSVGSVKCYIHAQCPLNLAETGSYEIIGKQPSVFETSLVLLLHCSSSSYLSGKIKFNYDTLLTYCFLCNFYNIETTDLLVVF